MNGQSSRRMSFLFFGVFLPVLLYFSSSAWACSCMNPGTPAESLKRSGAVFIGEVISEKPLMSEDQKKRKEQGQFVYVYDYEYQLRVEKSWKGIQEKTVTLISGVQGTACEFGRLKVGQRFLFYAYWDTRQKLFQKPVLGTSSCTRSRAADAAVVEVMFLDAAAQKKDPSPVYQQLPTILKSHSDPLYRAAAARYLGRDTPSPFPEGTVEALLAGLKDRDPMVRGSVARVITYQNFKKHHKAWREALNKAFEVEKKLLEKNPKSTPIRVAFRSIAGALVVYGDREVRLKTVPYFIQDLKDENFSIHYNALGKLRSIGPDAQAAVPALKLMLSHQDHYIRQSAMSTLKAIQAQGSLNEVVKSLDDDSCGVVVEAVKALDQIESPKAQKLLKEKGVPGLINKMGSSYCLSTASYTLERLDVPLSPYVPQLIEILNKSLKKKGNSFMRGMEQRDLIRILKNIGPNARQAIPVLESALSNPDKDIRRSAQSALDSINAFSPQRSKPTLTELEKQLKGPETPEWYRVVRQIKDFDNPKAWEVLKKEVVPRLIRKWKKGKLEDQASRSLMKCLEELSPQTEGVYPIFLEALEHSDSTTRLYAVYGLRKLGETSKPAVPQLIQLLKKSKSYTDWVSHNLVLTLKEMETPQAEAAVREYADKTVPKLLEVLTGDDAIRKNWVSQYLAPLVPYSKGLLSRLMTLFETNEDDAMRQEILKTVKMLGAQAKSAVPKLLFVLKSQGMEDEQLWSKVNQRIREIQALGPDHPEVSSKRSALLEILKRPELTIRMYGMEALLAIGTPEAKKVAEQYRHRVLPHLKKVVACQYKEAREQGVIFTVHLSHGSKVAVGVLTSALKDDYGRVRLKAVRGLSKLGSLAAPAVPDIVALLDDEYYLVRSLIPSTLKAIGTPEALQALQ